MDTAVREMGVSHIYHLHSQKMVKKTVSKYGQKQEILLFVALGCLGLGCIALVRPLIPMLHVHRRLILAGPPLLFAIAVAASHHQDSKALESLRVNTELAQVGNEADKIMIVSKVPSWLVFL